MTEEQYSVSPEVCAYTRETRLADTNNSLCNSLYSYDEGVRFHGKEGRSMHIQKRQGGGGRFNTTTREFDRTTRARIPHRAAALSRHSRVAMEATLIYGLGRSFPGLNRYVSGWLDVSCLEGESERAGEGRGREEKERKGRK